MKTNVMIMAMVMLGGTVGAQQVEIDDMYFTAKDRAAVVALREPKVKEQAKFLEESVPLNPTDSYSARNVNPEYISRAKMDPNSQVASSPYFIPNYQPVGFNQQINNFNNGPRAFSSWNHPNGMFGMGPFISQGLGNQFYPGSMWAMGLAGIDNGWNTWGSPSWNYWNSPMGWNSNWGWNSIWGWHSLGWNNWGMNSWAWNTGGWNNWGWNNWGMNSWVNPWAMNSFYGYSPSIVVINNENSTRGVVNGKRVSRSSDYNNQVSYDNRNTSYVDNNGRSRGSNAGGRSDGSNTYYQRGWRSDPTTSGSGSGSGNVSGGRSSNSSWWSDGSGTNSGSSDRSWSNSNGRGAGGSGFWNGNSSSGSNFSNGGGRSGGFTTGGSSGGAGGSSGGSRTRGRD